MFDGNANVLKQGVLGKMNNETHCRLAPNEQTHGLKKKGRIIRCDAKLKAIWGDDVDEIHMYSVQRGLKEHITTMTKVLCVIFCSLSLSLSLSPTLSSLSTEWCLC